MNKIRAATDTFKELVFIYVALLVGASLIFMIAEGHSFADSLYWAGTTATSTGYGDISPKTNLGRGVAVILMHLSIFVIAPMIVVRLIDRLNENRDAFTHEEQLLILEGIQKIDDRLARLEASAKDDERHTPAR
ncbi:potassium channel family protein [Sphingomonas sp. LY160]|uniref:potassium channel family protein n=1 Tax=Sphingomonas sp. LY160 TaxID=3095342 RepID=UPI002ADED152|nr:potassium channel family protein [Sphingomonas sp. LY160]MEA1072034.1 potassium channel family protein [Sphingomonas sp. LY160]